MTNVIEKSIDLRAPIDRVWRALTDPAEFGQWFGVKLEGSFEPGQPTRGAITYPGYEHVTMEVVTGTMQPPHLFSFTWHPYAIDPKVDYSAEPSTLVEFQLTQTADGTRLVVIESGFDALPDHRKADALRMNDSGWTEQLQNIKTHVEP
jgi:uncharacterized protein YndB with AHSA1/START domain